MNARLYNQYKNMKKYQYFYKHFLNEEAINVVSSSKPFRRIRHNWLMAFAFSFIPALLLSMCGLRIEFFSFPKNMVYWISLGFIALSLLHAIIFIVTANNHNFFKKKIILLAIAFSPLVAILISLAISFAVIPMTEPDGSTSYNVIVPLLFHLLIGFPASVIYLFFSYYAFLDKCQTMAHKLLGIETERYKEESKAASEELKKEIFNNYTYKYHAHKAEKNKKED